MAYTGDPTNSATDRIRLKVGDTSTTSPDFSDEEYEYFISITTNENSAALMALESLVMLYAQYVDEKTGDDEIYSSQRYEQYAERLDAARDPRRGFITMGVPFAGGIDKKKVAKDRKHKNSYNSDSPFGWSSHKPRKPY